MSWEEHAARLAGEVTDPMSRWRPLVASVPRHAFVPRWWDWDADGWTVIAGPARPGLWMRAAYADHTLVTRLGTAHADQARVGTHPVGRPTSSATQPGLVVAMYRHAGITDGSHVLDVGTGSGYGTALLARRLRDRLVTSIDVDDYLAGRLAVRPPPSVGPRRRHPPRLAHRWETARLRGSRHHHPGRRNPPEKGKLASGDPRRVTRAPG